MLQWLITSGFICSLQYIPLYSNESYPFLSWPINQTISRENTEVSLICMVHNCNHGAKLIIGYASNKNWTYDPASCLVLNESDWHLGVYIIQANVSLQNISSQQNASTLIPVWCKVGEDVTNASYIHVIDEQQPTTEPYTEVLSSTYCPCSFPSSTSSGDGIINFFKPSTFRLTECIILCMFIYLVIQILIKR